MIKKKKGRHLVVLISVAIFLLLEIAGYVIEGRGRRLPPDAAGAANGKGAKNLTAKNASLANKIKALAPRGIYIVVDTAENRLYLMQNQKVVKEVVVSCGSGDILEDLGGNRKWIFDTPRGEFSITSKLVNPTWIKPDWAFIEEGEKPPTNFNDRVDNDTLGDYALGFGDNFFIHGTLYTRLLGRNVTHGCVRAGDKDLKEIFQVVPMGARIYIY